MQKGTIWRPREGPRVHVQLPASYLRTLVAPKKPCEGKRVFRMKGSSQVNIELYDIVWPDNAAQGSQQYGQHCNSAASSCWWASLSAGKQQCHLEHQQMQLGSYSSSSSRTSYHGADGSVANQQRRSGNTVGRPVSGSSAAGSSVSGSRGVGAGAPVGLGLQPWGCGVLALGLSLTACGRGFGAGAVDGTLGLWQPAGSLLRTSNGSREARWRCWLVLTSRFWVLSLNAVSGREHSCFHGASCTSCIMAPSICTHNLTAAVLEGLQCSACCGRHTVLPAFNCIGADAQALHKHDTMEVTV